MLSIRINSIATALAQLIKPNLLTIHGPWYIIIKYSLTIMCRPSGHIISLSWKS